MEAFTNPCRGETEEHREGGPDVRGEVKSVGLERRAAVAFGNLQQLPRTPVVDGDRGEQHGERPERELDLDWMEEDAVDGFVGDPEAGDDHQAGFHEGGEVLNLAVAVGVIFVGGLAGDAHREEGEARAQQVDAGMRRIGEHAQRTGEDAGDNLQPSHRARREDRE